MVSYSEAVFFSVFFGFVVVERVTYRKLKRKAVILEYLQKVKVVEGSNPIQKVTFIVPSFDCFSYNPF